MTKVDELLIEGKVKEAIEIMCDLPEYEKKNENNILTYLKTSIIGNMKWMEY